MREDVSNLKPDGTRRPRRRAERAGAAAQDGQGQLRPEVPPSSNTGAENRKRVVNGPDGKVLVDWFAFTLREMAAEDVRDVVEGYIGEPLLLRPGGRDWYERCAVSPSGAFVCWNETGRMAEMGVHVELPGKACGVLDEAQTRGLAAYVVAKRGKFSRIDLAHDDYAWVRSPGEVHAACKSAEAVTRAQNFDLVQSTRAGVEGVTLYVGARGGRQMLRVYDKNAESGGEIDAVRWELESRQEAADTLGRQLVLGNWGALWARRVSSFIDFRDPDSSAEVERRTRLDWFSRLVGAAERASAYPARALMTMARVERWFAKQVAPMAAVLLQHYGGSVDQIESLIVAGRRKWGRRHVALLAGSSPPSWALSPA